MKVITFNDALVSQYAEQGAERGISPDHLAITNDSTYYSIADAISEVSHPMSTPSDCGCGSKSKGANFTTEQKIIVVAVVILGAFVLVSHLHLARIRR